MALNTYIKTNFNAKSTTALSGAAPQTGAGNTLSMVAARVAIGTLSATVTATAATSTLTITGKWQVSRNGSSWSDCFPQNNAAQVTITTGTASEVTRVVEAPDGVYGFPFARYVITTGVASAGAGDQYAIAYNFRQEA